MQIVASNTPCEWSMGVSTLATSRYDIIFDFPAQLPISTSYDLFYVRMKQIGVKIHFHANYETLSLKREPYDSVSLICRKFIIEIEHRRNKVQYHHTVSDKIQKHLILSLPYLKYHKMQCFIKNSLFTSDVQKT